MIPDLVIDPVRAVMLEDLRNAFFSTSLIVNDHSDLVLLVCHPRQGHGENLPDLEGQGTSARDAIESAWLKWRK